VACQRLRRRR